MTNRYNQLLNQLTNLTNALTAINNDLCRRLSDVNNALYSLEKKIEDVESSVETLSQSMSQWAVESVVEHENFERRLGQVKDTLRKLTCVSFCVFILICSRDKQPYEEKDRDREKETKKKKKKKRKLEVEEKSDFKVKSEYEDRREDFDSDDFDNMCSKEDVYTKDDSEDTYHYD